MAGTRPPLTTDITSVELLGWYRLDDELAGPARQLGTTTSGGER